jgi:branched-chain amino acid aminotransferase
MADQGKPKFAFFQGQIVPIAEAKVSVMNHALNYGTAVFGGLRGYWNNDERQLFVFRPLDHFERFVQSAGLIRINLPYNNQQLTDLLLHLLRTENFQENIYVRPLAYKSMEGIGVRLHDVPDDFTMFAMPMGSYMTEAGAHVCISAWRRVDDNAIPARGKISGAYANSALIKSDAILAGYDEALVLNEDGHIAEASAANVFMLRKGVLVTPPSNANVLEGIVRRTVIELAREELGMRVEERNIDRTEIYLADELFLCGTGVQIAPITRVEHRNIGSATMGDLTRELRNLFFNVVSGQHAKYRHWLTPVYQNEPAR